MADDIDRDDVPAPTTRPRRKRWALRILSVIILVPVLTIALWTVIALHWSYSRDGLRSGYVQKFSRKGWLCKTWEGQLAIVNVPGSQPEIFEFTVRNDSVARVLQQVMGDRVTLSYEQHKGVPFSCFGDTEYYVTGVRPINEMAPTAPMPPVAVPQGTNPAGTPSTNPAATQPALPSTPQSTAPATRP